MGTFLCLFSPVTCAATTLGKATIGDLFDALTGWIVASVQWLLEGVGSVLTSVGDPASVVRGAGPEFSALLVVAPVLLLVGLVVSTLQALRHGDAASLWRTYLAVAPACVGAIALARPMATLVLEAVDQLSSAAAATVAAHEVTLATALTTMPSGTPGFGLFLLAALVIVGAVVLWCELVVRAVVLTLLLALVPVVVALGTFPALRRAGWRLLETFLGVAASKFVIVVVLSLGLDLLTGSSPTRVVTGAVTLLLATATPFVLLRVVPVVEQSALHHLEGIRQRLGRSAQSVAAGPVGDAVAAVLPEPPLPPPPARPADLGIPMWEGGPDVELPPMDAEPPPSAAVGAPRLRKGHVAYFLDEHGPVVGWHFDE